MGIFLKIGVLLFSSLIILFGILFFRAEVYFSKPKDETFCNQTHTPIQGDELIERFSQALKFKTITQDTQKYETSEREKFAQFLRYSFPKIYSSPLVSFETVNNYSLLYHIKGSDQTLKPYLLCSHLDVVPVERKHWNYDPFGGVVEDGYIYGRGTLDLKNTLMAIMEALEYLLKNNFKPKRSFFIAIGHDEEGMGVDGAASIAETFRKKGINEFEYLFDEGSVIVRDIFPYIKKDIAFIGVAEKGFLTLKLKSKGQVGHSSIPTEDTAITSLARAVSKFTSTAHKSYFGHGPEVKMFEEFALHTSYPTKLIFSNLWLFGPLVSKVMSTKPQSNAVVRTTSAVTMINGGFKENVLPSEAEAIVNHRIHIAQTVKEVIEFDRQLINDDNIEIETKSPYHEPHPISPYDDDSFGYQMIKKSVYEVFENIVVIPGIMLATTDTKWYLPFTKCIYRFSPSIIAPDDFKLFHGHNERISKDNYIKTVNFYHHLMINSDKDKLESIVAKDEL